jgi:hypothetical protein
MTDSAPVKTDADGIPLLENAVTPQQLHRGETAPGVDLTDQEQVEQLMNHETVQLLLADLAEDLQKLVAWKVEEALKQELEKLIHEATERSIPRLREEIETHLSLALPELLARIAEQSRR